MVEELTRTRPAGTCARPLPSTQHRPNLEAIDPGHDADLHPMTWRRVASVAGTGITAALHAQGVLELLSTTASVCGKWSGFRGVTIAGPRVVLTRRRQRHRVLAPPHE